MSQPIDRRHGWALYTHPAFAEAFDRLTEQVAALARRDPRGYRRHPKAKLLKRVTDLILDEIPRDPAGLRFRLGTTLGSDFRHWRRAMFLGRFRLFFRYSSAHKAIVFAWLNDQRTLRKAGGRSDPYSIFLRRLEKGDPPDDWDALLSAARGGDD